ncbi:carboxyltransferase domain-containing protein [Vandammella animalimorsus]|uniref:5-oxoprolinase subunit B/C family protein n=1 Tax=Vandammella animalimorsus TaxID=2029117 RepID=UPI00325C20B5
MHWRALPAGDQALLLELEDLPQTLALLARLQAAQAQGLLPGLGEMVPAARTLLLQFDPHQCTAAQLLASLQPLLQTLTQPPGAQPLQGAQKGAARCVPIPVRYDGEDLDALAELLGLSRRELIERHTGCDYLAAFAGFAPGFVYLAGGHDCFAQVPRRATPRTRVPAGAVALAGHFSAIYPKASPGGWQLIGSTPCVMWDLQRPEPALIQPGWRVRFHDLERPGASISLPPAPSAASLAPPAPAQQTSMAPPPQPGACLEVRSTGLQTLLQDGGRSGQTALGVGRSGALDGWAMRAANRCVGNPPGTPVLENLLGQMVLVATGPAVLAVTGADVPLRIRSADGRSRQAATGCALALNAGDELQLGSPRAGARCYVAVRGGLQAPLVLGSAATDTLAGIGPEPLAAGARLPLLSAGALGPLQAVDADGLTWGAAARALPQPGQTVVLDVLPGPRADWFGPQALQLLQGQPWQVTPQSNRVGMRLAGAKPLQRAPQWAGQELPSEATVAGALQVPASGQPVLFLADHPLTGGYPVLAVLASHHLDLAAQIPADVQLRFRPIGRWPQGDAALPAAQADAPTSTTTMKEPPR